MRSTRGGAAEARAVGGRLSGAASASASALLLSSSAPMSDDSDRSEANAMTWQSPAVLKADAFRKDLVALRSDLTTVSQSTRRAAALETAKSWLDHYAVGATPGWGTAPAIRLLPEADHNAFRAALAETAMLAAHAEWLNGRHDADAVHLEKARSFNGVAKSAYGANAPAALICQSSELASGKPVVLSAASSDPAATKVATKPEKGIPSTVLTVVPVATKL